jgi:hypothetical protein
MRVKIRLETMKDVVKLVSIATKVDEEIMLSDGLGCVVSAKSLLGAALSKMEWENIYCECEKDISGKIIDFMV